MRVRLTSIAAAMALAAVCLAACNRQQDRSVVVSGSGAPPGASRSAPAPAAAPSLVVRDFMAHNARTAGVRTLPSGLQYQIIRSGPTTGLHPQRGDEVKVNYEGSLVTGAVFDSSYERGRPEAMPVNGLVAGWVEALQLMRPGDEWRLWVPPSLGYGQEATGPIPPGSVLIFRVELIDVLPAQERIGRG